jgi:hypothetical protein
MSSAAAKSPKPLRMNQKAVLIPAAQYQIWYDQAVLTSGLSELDRAVLDAVVAYYRLLEQRGYASVPSIEQMAKSSGARSIDISGAIRHLVGLALLAVKPGAGARRNEYLLALPKRAIASMATAAADDAPPF